MAKSRKTLLSGAEWPLKTPMWVLLQLQQGVAYVQGGQVRGELPVGALLVVPPNSPVTLWASVLGEAVVRGCSIKVNSLSGLLTLSERQCLETEAVQSCLPFRRLESPHSLIDRLAGFFDNVAAVELSKRLGLMQAFVDWLSPCLTKAAVRPIRAAEQTPMDRLRTLLNQRPESELTDLALGDLAKTLCCCERHASRLFQEVCGCSFREYIAELRLKKACQLLSHEDYKIIDVALESGHSSLALFNYNFKNRFRMTPTEWRTQKLSRDERISRSGFRASAISALG